MTRRRISFDPLLALCAVWGASFAALVIALAVRILSAILN